MGADNGKILSENREAYNNNYSKLVGFEVTLTDREKKLLRETWISIKRDATKVGIITFVG